MNNQKTLRTISSAEIDVLGPAEVTGLLRSVYMDVHQTMVASDMEFDLHDLLELARYLCPSNISTVNLRYDRAGSGRICEASADPWGHMECRGEGPTPELALGRLVLQLWCIVNRNQEGWPYYDDDGHLHST